MGQRFEWFAQQCDGDSPLYAHLCRRIARSPTFLELARVAWDPHLPANLMLAAVHECLLGGLDHPLRAWYPSVVGQGAALEVHETLTHDGDTWGVWEAFEDLVTRERSFIEQRMGTCRVQTNEVGRCRALLQGLTAVSQRVGVTEVALVEIGASAGLNLGLDRFAYRWSHDPAWLDLRARDGHGDALGPQLVCEVRGAVVPPLPDAWPPQVVWRRGVDLHPIDLEDADEARWLRALVWPDVDGRMVRLDGAIRVARAEDNEVGEGDVMEVLEAELDRAASGAPGTLIVLSHSHVWNQLTQELRQELAGRMRRWAAALPDGHPGLVELASEWLGTPTTELHAIHHGPGEGWTLRLAAVHHHGAWMEWLDEPLP